MNLKCINQCTDYFGYGNIDDSIIAESFSWKDCEYVDVSSVLEHIDLYNNKNNIYLITSRICQYPLSTFDKYYGLWNRIIKEHKLVLINMHEKKIEFDRFCVFFGISKISKSQLELALKLIEFDYSHSYILLSDYEKDLVQELETVIKKSKIITKYNFDYANIINSECYENEIITSIVGLDGCTINYFHLRNGK